MSASVRRGGSLRLSEWGGDTVRMSLTVTATGKRRPTFDTLAERLWWARESAGITQAALAAQLGIHKRTVQNYEHGDQYPRPNRLVLWANACDVDADWLAGNFYFAEGSDTDEGAGRDTRRCVNLRALAAA